MAGFLTSLIVVFLTGWMVVSIFYPSRIYDPSTLLKLFLSFGVGAGIHTSVLFIYLVIGGNFSEWSKVIDLIISAIAWGLWYIIKKGKGESLFLNSHSHRFLLYLFLIIVVLSSVGFILTSIKNPHGDWDAWMIWNGHARFLFRGKGDLKVMFKLPYWHHPDYPLLLPIFVARGWVYSGVETQFVPGVLAFLFTFATIGLLTSSLSLVKGVTKGVLAGAILTGTSYYILGGTSQCADIPFSYYLLSALTLLAIGERIGVRKLYTLTGMMAGFSAWTKNEGLLFVCIILFLYPIFIWCREGRGIALKVFLQLSLGCFPILLVVFLFKEIAPSTEILFSQDVREMVNKITKTSRYYLILKFFIHYLLEFKLWKVPGILLLIAYLLISGTNGKELLKKEIIPLIIVFSIMVGYVAVYLITPFELQWHLKTSMGRLLLHLYPAMIFSALWIVRDD